MQFKQLYQWQCVKQCFQEQYDYFLCELCQEKFQCNNNVSKELEEHVFTVKHIYKLSEKIFGLENQDNQIELEEKELLKFPLLNGLMLDLQSNPEQRLLLLFDRHKVQEALFQKQINTKEELQKCKNLNLALDLKCNEILEFYDYNNEVRKFKQIWKDFMIYMILKGRCFAKQKDARAFLMENQDAFNIQALQMFYKAHGLLLNIKGLKLSKVEQQRQNLLDEVIWYKDKRETANNVMTLMAQCTQKKKPQLSVMIYLLYQLKLEYEEFEIIYYNDLTIEGEILLTNKQTRKITQQTAEFCESKAQQYKWNKYNIVKNVLNKGRTIQSIQKDFKEIKDQLIEEYKFMEEDESQYLIWLQNINLHLLKCSKLKFDQNLMTNENIKQFESIYCYVEVEIKEHKQQHQQQELQLSEQQQQQHQEEHPRQQTQQEQTVSEQQQIEHLQQQLQQALYKIDEYKTQLENTQNQFSKFKSMTNEIVNTLSESNNKKELKRKSINQKTLKAIEQPIQLLKEFMQNKQAIEGNQDNVKQN